LIELILPETNKSNSWSTSKRNGKVWICNESSKDYQNCGTPGIAIRHYIWMSPKS